MNPMKMRLLDLAAGWEGSDAVVTLTPADALAVGVQAERGRPLTITGKELFAKATALPDHDDALPDGAELTPTQQSTSPGPRVAVPPVSPVDPRVTAVVEGLPPGSSLTGRTTAAAPTGADPADFAAKKK